MLNPFLNWRNCPTNDWFLLPVLSLEKDLAIFFHVKRDIRVISVYNTANTIKTHTPGRCHDWNFLVYKKVIYTKRPAIPNENSITNTPSQPTWVQKVILTFMISFFRFFFSGGVFLSTSVSSTSFGSAGLSSTSMTNDNGWCVSLGCWMLFLYGWKNVTARLAIGLVCVAEENIL